MVEPFHSQEVEEIYLACDHFTNYPSPNKGACGGCLHKAAILATKIERSKRDPIRTLVHKAKELGSIGPQLAVAARSAKSGQEAANRVRSLLVHWLTEVAGKRP